MSKQKAMKIGGIKINVVFWMVGGILGGMLGIVGNGFAQDLMVTQCDNGTRSGNYDGVRGSLRDQIWNACEAAGDDLISFNCGSVGDRVYVNQAIRFETYEGKPCQGKVEIRNTTPNLWVGPSTAFKDSALININAPGVTVSGLSLIYSPGDAIRVEADNATLSGNYFGTIQGTGTGGNSAAAIRLAGSAKAAVITQNTFSYNGIGVQISDQASNHKVTDNIFSDNDHAVVLDGTRASVDNQIRWNTYLRQRTMNIDIVPQSDGTGANGLIANPSQVRVMWQGKDTTDTADDVLHLSATLSPGTDMVELYYNETPESSDSGSWHYIQLNLPVDATESASGNFTHDIAARNLGEYNGYPKEGENSVLLLAHAMGTTAYSTSEFSLPAFVDRDNDRDGIGQTDDCDDGDPTITTGTPTTYYPDRDGDGYGDLAEPTQVSCGTPPGYFIQQGGDCNDANPAIHPNATEICNGLDDNCNGARDDGLPHQYYYRDNDGDGLGSMVGRGIDTCEQPSGYVSASNDCNDRDASILSAIIFYPDADGDGYGEANLQSAKQVCGKPAGYSANSDDCDDSNKDIYPGATEVCDGKDNNCNGTIDEGVTTTYYQDADKDGYGNAAIIIASCTDGDGITKTQGDCDDTNKDIHPGTPETCGDGIDQDCSGADLRCDGSDPDPDADSDGISIAQGDCDDTNKDIHPGAPEVCDDKDNNCNGTIDEGVTTTYYQDTDQDGYGNAAKTIASCQAQVAGYVNNSLDCNDADPTMYPGAVEICDGKDNDCNDETDEGPTCGQNPDQNAGTTDSDGDGATPDEGDCNDTDPTMSPNAIDIPGDGIDQNCDGADAVTNDFDGDGMTTSQGDCNDADPTVYLGAPESQDGKDNDCNNVTDDVPTSAEDDPLPGDTTNNHYSLNGGCSLVM